jgi:lipid-binding SYLF domain-containing protein
MKQHLFFGIILSFVLLAHPVAAEWEADTADKQQVKAAKAIEQFRSRIPRTEQYFDKAYAYAVLPSVTRIGFGFGGAAGKGIVVEGDNVIGKTRFWQFSSGLQAGAKNFSMILFFKDKDALDDFKASKLQFMGQAGIAVATVGVAGTPTYNEGVAIVTVTRLGLMAEFSYSGAKFSYEDVAKEN